MEQTLENRLSKYKLIKNLSNYNYKGFNDRVNLYYNNEEFVNIIYDSSDSFFIKSCNLKNESLFPAMLLYLEAITTEIGTDIFFSEPNTILSNLLESINYQISEENNNIGLYLDLLEYESFEDRLNELKLNNIFSKFIK